MNFASGSETQTCGKGKVSCQAIYSSIMPNIQHNLLDSTTFYQVYTYKKKCVSMIKLYFNIVICFYFNLCSLNICSSYVENFKCIKIFLNDDKTPTITLKAGKKAYEVGMVGRQFTDNWN